MSTPDPRKVSFGSAHADPKGAFHGMDVSGAAFLRKPFRMEALLAVVRRALPCLLQPPVQT
jgi:FixJ family two-component response regulator